ncbi:MAG: CpsD/CapB family tyrosine-protein kinase [Actinomycetota bacterium]|nr:CpsD/CapB family tyrosine-protein kinase [Actinomycetota bacterium]
MQPAPTDRPGAVLARAVRDHWLVVLLLVTLTVGAAYAALSRQQQRHRASAEILVTPFAERDEAVTGLGLIRDTGDPARTVQTAAALVESQRAAERAARALGQRWTREAVLGAVDVQPRGESNILAVTATATSQEDAVAVADAFARAALTSRQRELETQLDARIRQLRGRLRTVPQDDFAVRNDLAERLNQLEAVRVSGHDPTLTLAQPASPAGTIGTPASLVLGLAALAGVAVGTLAAVGLEFARRRLRDEAEIRRAYPLPVLTRVPRLPRGSRGVGRQRPSATPAAVREAFRTLRLQLEQRRSTGPRSILVTSASAGDGKTTAAANLAFALAEAGYSVIAVDFDLRKPELAAALGVQPSQGLAALLTGQVELEDALVPSPESPGLRVLPAAGGDAVMLEALMRRLPEILAETRELAECVVVDSPPLGEVADALRVVAELDEVVLVVRPGHTTRRRFELTRDLLERAGSSPTGLVLTAQALEPSKSYYVYGAANGSGPRERIAR